MNIFIIGDFGFNNTGSEIVLSAMVTQMRRLYPTLRVLVASGNPPETAKCHGVEAVAWNRISELRRAVQLSDIVIAGGQNLFNDCHGIDPSTILTGSHRGLSYCASVALLCLLHDKPFFLYGVEAGPLSSAHGAQLARALCETACCITVCDAGSKQVLELAGVDSSRIIVTADPVFGLGTEQVTPDSLPRRPRAGVAVYSWSPGLHPDFFEQELASGLDLFLEQSGGSVVFFPFQEAQPERDDDRLMARRIQSHMHLAGRTGIFRREASPAEVYTALAQCDLLAGMRRQALIAGVMNSVPLVALSTGPQIDELIQSFSLDEWRMDVSGIEAAKLARRILDALQRRDTIGQPLDGIRQQKQQSCRESGRLAMEVLSGARPLLPTGPEMTALLCSGLRAQIARMEQLESRQQATGEDGEAMEAMESNQVREDSAEHKKLAEAARTLEEENRANQRRIQELEVEKLSIGRSLDELRGKLARESERLAKAQSAYDDCAANLQVTRQAGAALLHELDLFRQNHENELNSYRSQRAWQVMLLIRKAYTLLRKEPLSRSLPWLLKVPFWQFGSLAEYDLRFPDVADYIPDRTRALLTAADAPQGTAAVAPLTPDLPSVPPQQKYDVVILAIIDFDFRFQRPQQIAVEFARRGHRVFWVSPTRFLSPDSPQAYETKTLRPNLWEVHLRGPQPDIYMGALTEAHLNPLTASLRQLLNDWAVSESAVMAQLPFWRQLALAVREAHGSKVLYDCMDDWETFPNIGAFNISEENLFTHESDVLVVTAAELAHKFEAQGLKPVLARNGADYEFFASSGPNNLLAGVQKPIVGYFGAIADWIDLDLVYEVARLRPDYTFVMIGQVFGRDVNALQSLPNVQLLGNKRYEDIPFYLHHFDVCTIPFLINQVTKATDPVKLYEYFSLGKPVVATAMAELKQCDDLLYIAADAEEFARHLDTAIAESGDSLRKRRLEFSQANTWGRRVDEIDKAIRNSFGLVSILLITHNSERFVKPCLDSILNNTSYPNYEVIVVDNASTDGTLPMLREYASRDSRIQIVASASNLGFAGGNNLAARKAAGEALLLLNIDTIVTPGWIGRLLRHLRTDPSVGLICPVTNFAGNEAKINVPYTNYGQMIEFSQQLARTRRGESTEVKVAPLFCALLSKQMWDRVGELDSIFEIGMFEDDDYSLRVWEDHRRVVAAEDCFIHHFGQGSFSKLTSETYNKIFENNLTRFEKKWNRKWSPHRTRPGVRPPHEEQRFTPDKFV